MSGDRAVPKRRRDTDGGSHFLSNAKRRRHVPSVDCDDDMLVESCRESPLRSHPHSAFNLLHLPVLSRILYYVTAGEAEAPSQAVYSPYSPQMDGLRQSVSLREVSRGMRDAFDEHVTAFDFKGFDRTGIEVALRRTLPRYVYLTRLCCNQASTDEEFSPHWKTYFASISVLSSRTSKIRDLRFVDTTPFSSVPETIAAGCGQSVEHLQVMSRSPPTSTSILSAVAQHCPNVSEVEALLDGVDCRVLAGFNSLRRLRAVFRKALDPLTLGMLTWALTQCSSSLEGVELRIHNNVGPGVSVLDALPLIPKLWKLSLFNCVLPLPGVLLSCSLLREVQFEWMDISDSVLDEILRILGGQLTGIRIWNCERLTDAALRSIHLRCPHVRVDLKYRGPQFSPHAVRSLPNVNY